MLMTTPLEKSIAHWELNAKAETPYDAGVGTESELCALCDEFMTHRNIADHCVGCPVKAATGKIHCEGTPWHTAAVAFLVWKADSSNEDRKDAFHQSSAKELDFLRSLRDED